MLLYCYIGEHDQAKKLIPLVIENLDKYDSKINNEDLLRIYHAIAMVYFGIGEFNKSLHWLNKIINQNYENLRQDIVRISKLIYLIVHFEIGNDDLLHYIYKSTLRFFNTQKNQHQFEAIFLNHFKKIAILKKENKQGDPYQLLKKELITVFKNSFEKNALEFFNFYAWLDSKTYSISFSDAIRLRKENL
jgi:tetratricopeptide (TPR) repeat protein